MPYVDYEKKNPHTHTHQSNDRETGLYIGHADNAMNSRDGMKNLVYGCLLV